MQKKESDIGIYGVNFFHYSKKFVNENTIQSIFIGDKQKTSKGDINIYSAIFLNIPQ